MKVKLCLYWASEDHPSYEALWDQGYMEAAYKEADLPVVFPGLDLWIPFINKSGEKDSSSFTITRALYDLEFGVLSVDVEYTDTESVLPNTLMSMITEENGWKKYTSLDGN